MLRRLAVLVALGLAVAVPAAAQTEPARLAVTATSDPHQLGPAPDSATGSFSLPFDFYATVTVYATVPLPDGQVTTNASWAIPVADCAAPAPPTTTTTITEPT